MASGLFGSYMVKPPNALGTSRQAKQFGAFEENLVFFYPTYPWQKMHSRVAPCMSFRVRFGMEVWLCYL